MSELVAQVVWQRPPAGTLQRGWFAVPAPWLAAVTALVTLALLVAPWVRRYRQGARQA